MTAVAVTKEEAGALAELAKLLLELFRIAGVTEGSSVGDGQ